MRNPGKMEEALTCALDFEATKQASRIHLEVHQTLYSIKGMTTSNRTE